MATDTTIEWADKTWSPIIGCDRVSPGCDRCYAMGVARIREFNPNPKIREAFAGTTINDGNGVDWSGKVNLLDDRLTQPMAWKKPRKVFVNSLSDLFHKDVPSDFIAQVFAVMALTPRHTYQILTKRHARMRSLLNDPAFEAQVDRALLTLPALSDPEITGRSWPLPKPGWPLPNVHLGVSVENQQWANTRIPALLDTPAAVRWISAEPLLGPVDLKAAVRIMGSERGHGLTASFVHAGGCCQKFHGLDWVVAGGETGAKARPSHPDWFRSLRDQCAAADVPYFFKQHGDWAEMRTLHGDDRLDAWDDKRTRYVHPVDGRIQSHGDWNAHDHLEGWAIMQRVGKKTAGRLLDGRQHDDYPAVIA